MQEAGQSMAEGTIQRNPSCNGEGTTHSLKNKTGRSRVNGIAPFLNLLQMNTSIKKADASNVFAEIKHRYTIRDIAGFCGLQLPEGKVLQSAPTGSQSKLQRD